MTSKVLESFSGIFLAQKYVRIQVWYIIKAWGKISVNVRCRFPSPLLRLQRYKWCTRLQNKFGWIIPRCLIWSSTCEKFPLTVGSRRICGKSNHDRRGWVVFWAKGCSERITEWTTGDGGKTSVALHWELAKLWKLSCSTALWFIKKINCWLVLYNFSTSKIGTPRDDKIGTFLTRLIISTYLFFTKFLHPSSLSVKYSIFTISVFNSYYFLGWVLGFSEKSFMNRNGINLTKWSFMIKTVSNYKTILKSRLKKFSNL